MAKNKILEILERIDVEKVSNETLKKKIIELKDDVKDYDDSHFSKSKEAEEAEKAYINNANTAIKLVEKAFPAALSSKAVVSRKPKEERPKAPEKKVEPKPEPKKEEKKPVKVVIKPKAKKEPENKQPAEKKYKVTPKSKKPEAKKEIEVKVRPTDELSNVRNILEEANYTVIVKKVGKTTVKRKAPRQDRTIVKDKVEDVFTTIQKDIPKEKDAKQVEKVTDNLKAIFTKILVAIDKLTTSGNLSQLQKLEAFLKKLVQKEKFEGGDAIGGEKKKYEITLYKFYAVKVYENRNGRTKSSVILNENGLPVLFETNDLSYRNIEKLVESKAMKSIKGYPRPTSLFSLHTSVKQDDNEWVSDGEQYQYRGIGYDGVWSLNGLQQDIKPLENVEFAKGGGVDYSDEKNRKHLANELSMSVEESKKFTMKQLWGMYQKQKDADYKEYMGWKEEFGN